MTNMPKPMRSFGLSIAIISSVLLFTGVPFFQLAIFMLVSRPMYEDSGIVTGVNVGVIDQGQLFLQVLLASGFFIIALFGWNGRPAGIRRVLSFSVIGMTVYNISFILLPAILSTPNVTVSGIDSSFELSRQLRIGQLVSSLLVTVYVVWYLNRWPARAFFRGYYLPEEWSALQAIQAPHANDEEGASVTTPR